MTESPDTIGQARGNRSVLAECVMLCVRALLLQALHRH